jgi:shikimate kinase
MKVFLVGYMGVGKTTLGSRLAKILGNPFIDLDKALESEEGMTIRDIFAERGEAYFREKESLMLRRLTSENEEFVLSTGGGAPLQNGNMDYMNDSGCTVWLKMSDKMIFDRLRQGKEKRPLIANKSDAELMEFIHESLSKRESTYAEAAITHNAQWNDSGTMKLLADSIRAFYSR